MKEEKKDIEAGVRIVAQKVLSIVVPPLGIPLEAYFQIQNENKQRRINNFVKLIQDFVINEMGDNIEINAIDTEQFYDFFESVLIKVSRNSNEEKIVRFKSIIINQIKSPIKIEYAETFLDLIPKLTEKHFEILYAYNLYGSEFITLNSKLSQLKNDPLASFEREMNSDKEEQESHDKKVEKLTLDIQNFKKTNLSHESFFLEEGEYEYLIQDMISKSLMVDVSVYYFEGLLFVLKLTHFGKDFVSFFKEK